jgi:tyrosyl-tRNA synthetase
MASEDHLVDKKYHLITRRLQEVLGGDIIKNILAEGGRSPKCYWGMCLFFCQGLNDD